MKSETSKKKQNQKIDILFEDKWLIVINKPEGLLSVPYDGYRGKTALSILTDIARKKGTLTKYSYPTAVHRLDRDTSGVMMFAKTEETKKIIMDNWNSLVTERLYKAICINTRKSLKEESGTIDSPIAYNAYHQGYVPKENTVNPKNQKNLVTAVTHFKRLSYNNNYSLFELALDTGRKNQIRAHLASIGFPVAGDSNYRFNAGQEKLNCKIGRLGLHAYTLSFTHPNTKEKMHFEVKEPKLWNELSKNE